jgi:hypothetical protein
LSKRVLVPFFVAVLSVTSQGQTKSASKARTSTILVDTDDSCRLVLDGDDKGVITPAESKKINVTFGEHVLKCVIEKAPDLTWRKVVNVTTSDQTAVIVALKALHVQYDDAIQQAQQKKEQEAAAEQQRKDASAAEEQQRIAAERQRAQAEADYPRKFYDAIKGVWKVSWHDPGQGTLRMGSLGIPVDTSSDQGYSFEFTGVDNSGVIQTKFIRTLTTHGNGFEMYVSTYAVGLETTHSKTLVQKGPLQCLSSVDIRGKKQKDIACGTPVANIRLSFIDTDHAQFEGWGDGKTYQLERTERY